MKLSSKLVILYAQLEMTAVTTTAALLSCKRVAVISGRKRVTLLRDINSSVVVLLIYGTLYLQQSSLAQMCRLFKRNLAKLTFISFLRYS